MVGSGSNYLVSKSSNDFNLSDYNFNLSASVLFSGGIPQWAGIFEEWGTAESYQLYFGSVDGAKNSVTPFFSYTDKLGYHLLTGAANLSLNKWLDVEVSRNGNQISMYVDGKNIGMAPVSGALSPATAPVWIGMMECQGNTVCWNQGGKYYIDDVKLTKDDRVKNVLEPSSFFMAGVGLLFIGVVMRRKKIVHGINVR